MPLQDSSGNSQLRVNISHKEQIKKALMSHKISEGGTKITTAMLGLLDFLRRQNIQNPKIIFGTDGADSDCDPQAIFLKYSQTYGDELPLFYFLGFGRGSDAKLLNSLDEVFGVFSRSLYIKKAKQIKHVIGQLAPLVVNGSFHCQLEIKNANGKLAQSKSLVIGYGDKSSHVFKIDFGNNFLKEDVLTFTTNILYDRNKDPRTKEAQPWLSTETFTSEHSVPDIHFKHPITISYIAKQVKLLTKSKKELSETEKLERLNDVKSLLEYIGLFTKLTTGKNQEAYKKSQDILTSFIQCTENSDEEGLRVVRNMANVNDAANSSEAEKSSMNLYSSSCLSDMRQNMKQPITTEKNDNSGSDGISNMSMALGSSTVTATPKFNAVDPEIVSKIARSNKRRKERYEKKRKIRKKTSRIRHIPRKRKEKTT